MHRIYIPILAAFFLISLSASAQSNKKQIRQIEPDAKEMFRVEEYEKALPLYRKLDSLEPENPEFNFRLGVCYLNSPYKAKALPFFERAKRFNYQEKHLNLYLGRSYHYSHYFDTALQYYNIYRKHLESEGSGEEIAVLDKFIEECKVGLELIAKPVEVVIENLGPVVNTQYSEYGPVISADEEILIFTSRRPNSTGGKVDLETLKPYEDMYISYKKDKQWTSPEQLPGNVNSETHDASIGLSPDGQVLFVYRNSEHATELTGDIYESDLKGEEWSDPVKMPNPLNSDSWEPSASITPDENTIYFSSNREGGFGGTDIYTIKRLPSGDWAEPVNLGSTINTPYDEDGPFIHPDGKTLYFSSRGHRTMGGFDIFKTKLDADSGTWSTPENLGYPINTADDDIYYVLSADGLRAYFASVREDTYGESDIYIAYLPAESVPIIQFKGHVYRSDNQRPVAATITIMDNQSQELIGITNSNSFNGRFTTILPPKRNYNITVDLSEFLFFSENINVPDQVEYYEVSKEIYLQPLSLEGAVSAMRNIFFLPGEAEIRVESEIELNNIYKKMMSDPELMIEIAAHTDNQGDPMVNKLLSQARAQAVKDFLIAKGIDESRLYAVGYGDEFPIASNETEEGRAQNRRVEVITLHGLETGFESGTEEAGYYYRSDVSPFQEGGADETLVAAPLAGLPPNFKAGAKLEGVKIEYEFDSDKVRRAYFPVLDSVLNFMKRYPKVRMEVAGHTCNIGPDAYNLQLSERRVNSAVTYLTYKGIDANRLVRKGYGESKPMVSNDTRENRSKNRRVEFIMLDSGNKSQE